LAALVHPWETGLDNSPAWDRPLAAVPADLSLFDTYTRRDVAHAGAGERPTDQDYARYIRLMLRYRDHGYDDDWVRAKAEFLVVDPAFNALWAWSELALADIARRLGRDDSTHVAEAARITAAMVGQLWSEGRGLFLACDARSGRQLPERTVAGLIPLVLPGLPTEMADALVATATGEAFRIGAPDVHGVPSFDLTDVRHEPRRYWRGPTWLNTTWLVARGLQVHGHKEMAQRLDDDLVGLVAKSGFREYFHPRTGRGHGSRSFSWSAALLIHVLAGSEG
jgi:glycogen debranching enzyme